MDMYLARLGGYAGSMEVWLNCKKENGDKTDLFRFTCIFIQLLSWEECIYTAFREENTVAQHVSTSPFKQENSHSPSLKNTLPPSSIALLVLTLNVLPVYSIQP